VAELSQLSTLGRNSLGENSGSKRKEKEGREGSCVRDRKALTARKDLSMQGVGRKVLGEAHVLAREPQLKMVDFK
jgi:hypothetical protein